MDRFEPAAVTIARLTEERDTALAKVSELRAKYERLKALLRAEGYALVGECGPETVYPLKNLGEQ